MNLTTTCVEAIRSPKLARMVAAMIIKLKKALVSPVERMVRTVGRSTAQKLSMIAQNWGNKLAHRLDEDERFARYLAVVHLNRK